MGTSHPGNASDQTELLAECVSRWEQGRIAWEVDHLSGPTESWDSIIPFPRLHFSIVTNRLPVNGLWLVFNIIEIKFTKEKWEVLS